MNKIAYILVDRHDNYVACCTQPKFPEHPFIIREEDGLTYQAVTDINANGERIGTIYKEKVGNHDE